MLDNLFAFLNKYIVGVLAVLGIIIIVVGYFALFVWGTPTAITVTDHRWETYQVDQVYESYYWYSESCTTTRVNKKTVRSCISIPHYAERWRSYNTRWLGGVYGDEHIIYPEVIKQGEGNALGNIRPAESGLNYLVVFTAEDGSKSNMTISEADFPKYPIGDKWKAIKTILGSLRWDTLEKTS